MPTWGSRRAGVVAAGAARTSRARPPASAGLASAEPRRIRRRFGGAAGWPRRRGAGHRGESGTMADQQRLTTAERENLVAYIDGELNDVEARALATKLTQ